MHNTFNSFGSFFMNVTGSMPINEEHYIGVSISGNKDNVMIKSLRCSVEVQEPNIYGLGDKSPSLRFIWSIEYLNWNRSKGAWGKRLTYSPIDKEFVNKIINFDNRVALEQTLVTKLEEKITNGTIAIMKRYEGINK